MTCYFNLGMLLGTLSWTCALLVYADGEYIGRFHAHDSDELLDMYGEDKEIVGLDVVDGELLVRL